jgi:hypothetical protein
VPSSIFIIKVSESASKGSLLFEIKEGEILTIGIHRVFQKIKLLACPVCAQLTDRRGYRTKEDVLSLTDP